MLDCHIHDSLFGFFQHLVIRTGARELRFFTVHPEPLMKAIHDTRTGISKPTAREIYQLFRAGFGNLEGTQPSEPPLAFGDRTKSGFLDRHNKWDRTSMLQELETIAPDISA
jgi:hypothetical protein